MGAPVRIYRFGGDLLAMSLFLKAWTLSGTQGERVSFSTKASFLTNAMLFSLFVTAGAVAMDLLAAKPTNASHRVHLRELKRTYIMVI